LAENVRKKGGEIIGDEVKKEESDDDEDSEIDDEIKEEPSHSEYDSGSDFEMEEQNSNITVKNKKGSFEIAPKGKSSILLF
jgi:hypothetical protein